VGGGEPGSDEDYFVEWREDGRRRRQPAGNTAAQAMEEQPRERHELEAHALGLAPRNETSEVVPAAQPPPVRKLIDRYLDQIKTLKRPNTHRKYHTVLTRFAKVFDRLRRDTVFPKDRLPARESYSTAEDGEHGVIPVHAINRTRAIRTISLVQAALFEIA
jgi:hypothetical protein